MFLIYGSLNAAFLFGRLAPVSQSSTGSLRNSGIGSASDRMNDAKFIWFVLTVPLFYFLERPRQAHLFSVFDLLIRLYLEKIYDVNPILFYEFVNLS
jgi:hypothetical protein